MNELGWQLGLLREIAQPVSDKWMPTSTETDVPYVGLEHISPETPKIGEYGNSSEVISTKNLFKTGDTLFGKLRPYLKKVALADLSGVCSTDIIPIRANEKADPLFLYYLLSSPKIIAKAVESSAGNVMPRASWSDLADIEIEIPPLPEQKKIAEILSGIDLLNQGIQAKIRKLKEVRNALIQNLQLEGSGEWVALSEISNLITSGSRGWSQYYSDAGSKFVRIGNLSRNSIDLDPAPDKWQLVAPPKGSEGERTKLKEGDILISITADLGICSIYSAAIGDTYINQHIALVRVDSRHIGYSRQIAYYICSEHCQEQIRSMNDSGAKAGLNLDSIRRIRVPLIQGGANNRVVRSIDAIQSAISGNLLRLQHLADEKSSLTSELLSGRKRVSV